VRCGKCRFGAGDGDERGELSCLKIATYRGPEEVATYFLVLERSGRVEGAWERVGMGREIWKDGESMDEYTVSRRYTFPLAFPMISLEKSLENAPTEIPPDTEITSRTKVLPLRAWTFYAFTIPSDAPV